MDELKPCPFCGGKETDDLLSLYMGFGGSEWIVECDRCGANLGWRNYNREEAIEAWNRRASDEP
ncbi:MAG: Lar family restriction alleviation protein [Clostridia bacterium]|nr:Lar family restriction alleviation protein [Clostridia bacterium]